MRRLMVIQPLLLIVFFFGGCSTSSEAPSGSTGVPGPSGNPYQLEVQAPEKVSVGQQATTEVVITPRNGFKINVEYPAKLTFDAVPEGTELPEQTISKGQMSVDEKRLVVPVRFVATAPGDKQFAGEFRFSVCNDKTCQMPREQVSWSTKAEAATP